MEKFALKLTAAVVLDGSIRVAGSIVHVDHKIAENLLQRGKAEVATEADETVTGDGTGTVLPPVDSLNQERVAPGIDPAPAPAPAPEPAQQEKTATEDAPAATAAPVVAPAKKASAAKKAAK